MIIGSLALAPDTAYPEGVDLALFPYQGSEQLCSIAEGIYHTLDPQAVLLTHFDDSFPPFSTEVDTSDFESFLKDRAEVYKLGHGGSVEI